MCVAHIDAADCAKEEKSMKKKKGMKREHTSNRVWRAIGENGSFLISQTGTTFWAQYISRGKSFKMPPKQKLSEAKSMCEDNEYWED